VFARSSLYITSIFRGSLFLAASFLLELAASPGVSDSGVDVELALKPPSMGRQDAFLPIAGSLALSLSGICPERCGYRGQSPIDMKGQK